MKSIQARSNLSTKARIRTLSQPHQIQKESLKQKEYHHKVQTKIKIPTKNRKKLVLSF